MKSAGIIRQVDELGQVVLPIELRKQFGIMEKDYLEVFITDDTMTLKKCTPHCSRCDNTKDIIKIKGKFYCRECIKHMKEAGV